MGGLTESAGKDRTWPEHLRGTTFNLWASSLICFFKQEGWEQGNKRYYSAKQACMHFRTGAWECLVNFEIYDIGLKARADGT